jgi:hypothetical protein
MDSGHLRIEFDLCPINGNPPSLYSYMTKASMRFYILGFQTLRMGKGKGLQGFYLIDNLIMNLLKGSIYISSPKAHEVWKSGMGFHLSMN